MSLYKYRTPRGQIRWRTQVCVDRQRVTKSFKTHLDAAIWHDAKEKSLKSNIPLDGAIPAGDMLFIDASGKFIIECRQTVSRAHLASYDCSRKALLKNFPDDILLSQITPPMVSAHILKRMTDDGVGPSSVRQELSFLRMLYIKPLSGGVLLPVLNYLLGDPRHACVPVKNGWIT